MYRPVVIDWRTFVGERDGKRMFRVSREVVGYVLVQTECGVTTVGPVVGPLAMPERWKQEQDFARIPRAVEVPVG